MDEIHREERPRARPLFPDPSLYTRPPGCPSRHQNKVNSGGHVTTLAERRGSLVSRAELLKEVWGYRSDVESRTVDTHIAKLRSKIDRGDQSCIVTVRKRGYRLR